MKYYFSADLHLGHSSIIKYDKRPFASVEEMNAAIIGKHNKIVTDEDVWYFLGDLCMGDRSMAEGYLQQLNGKKFFIAGDHDKQKTIELFKKYGTYLGRKADIVIDRCLISLSHFPLETWAEMQHGSWLLHGHSHHNVPDNPSRLSLDVGINGWNYTPVSFEEIERKMHARINTMQDSLRGKVINIDKFGNATVNITKAMFEQFIGDKKFEILANVGSIKKICVDYDDGQDGEFLALFNAADYLELAINNGRVDRILGLSQSSSVLIQKF